MYLYRVKSAADKFNRQQLYLDIPICIYKTIQQTNSIKVRTHMVNCAIGSILSQFCIDSNTIPYFDMGTW